MKNLSLNLLSNARNYHGQGRQFNQTNNNGGQNSGGGKQWKNVPTCYNCGELGHISPQCDKPKRLGGDMYPLPAQLPNRSSDYGIEIKGDEAGPSRFITEEKGKAKVLNVVKLKKTSVLEDSLVMPIGKRTTEEKEGRSGAGPSKKKGKVYEGEDVKVKQKRRARRKFHVTDFPLGEGQESYSLKEDLTIDELPDICPIVDVWHKRKNLGQGYVDGGAQICVITQTCVEKMGVAVAGVSGFRIRMANHQKVKCLGMVKSLEVEVYAVKAICDFHVMPAGLGAYPIILGRPWLRAVSAVQDWRRGTISLFGRTGGKKFFDMNSRKPLDGDFEEKDESSDEDSSTIFELDSDSTSSSDDDVDVAFLLMDEEQEETKAVTFVGGIEEEYEGPYEVIEELMQPKVELSKKQELVARMLKIAVEDQRKTTFITPWGYFCYTMLPFGLTNGPAYYQKRANWALSPFIDSFVKDFIDDFCVYSTRTEHCEKLEMVLKHYDECGENGIEADPDKVKAMVLLPSPKDSKQVATFVHKVKYMARFIPLVSQVLYPLQQAAKQDPLVRNEECEAVFQNVKEILGGLPAMQAPVWEQVFYANPSVGEDAIGAMLLQKGKKSKYMRPVYCASRVKFAAERKLSEVELVMVSVVFSCRRFRHYLLPRPFVFWTSYAFLPQLINGINMSKAVKKWVIELQEFEFSFLVEESTRATLADLLTYKESPLLIKEEVIKKVEEHVKELNNAHILFFDGSYRKSHDVASGGIALNDPEGKLVCKKGFKLDAHSNNEAEYATLEAGLHICLKHGVKRLLFAGRRNGRP
ncbi:hypothetical protein L7F22_055725 [Adiantum nelumboides]|nr:hypothetical protein [Adiantum nelumboides]